MPLSKFTDTFNLPDVVSGTFLHCFNTPNNYGYVGLLPTLHYYEPNDLKEPTRSKLIKWHGEHGEIHQYCTADVPLLKSGCMKFRASVLADTEIDFLQLYNYWCLYARVSFFSLEREDHCAGSSQWLQKYAKLLKQVDGMDHILRKDHRCPIQTRVVCGQDVPECCQVVSRRIL